MLKDTATALAGNRRPLAAIEAALAAAHDARGADWWLAHREKTRFARGAAGEPRLGNSVGKSSAITESPSIGPAPTAKTLAAEASRRRRRAQKFARRNEMRGLLRALGRGEHPMTACGLAVTSTNGVQLRLSDGKAGIAGVATCGRRVCEVCAAKIAAHDADELGQVLGWARGQGYALAMVTLTVRHQLGDPLSALWDAVADGWAQATSGSVWASESQEVYANRLADWRARGAAHDAGELDPATGKRQRAPKGWKAGEEPARRVGDAERNGVVGWARATEVTVSPARHGWHVHVHAVLVIDRLGRDDVALRRDIQALGEGMHARWTRGVQAVGFDSWRDYGGLDVSITDAPAATLATYLTKSGGDSAEHVRNSVAKAAKDLAREATLGAFKDGRRGGVTPLQLARAAVSDVAELKLTGVYSDAIAFFEEYLDASHGRRMVGWSVGLRELAGLMEDEKDDEEKASGETGSDDDALLNLPVSSWWKVQRDVTGLLDAAEVDGYPGAVEWLTARGIPWRPPSPLVFAGRSE